MVRKSGVVLSLLGGLFAAPILLACQASFHAGSGNNPQTAPPAPPPPPPQAATPSSETDDSYDSEDVEANESQEDTDTEEANETAPEESGDGGGATVKRGRVLIPGNIVFDTGKASLKEGSGSEDVLEQLKDFLAENEQVTKIRIEGHTDNQGDPAANEELSGQRSLTIKKWLTDAGISADRLLAVGFGQSHPIADNATEEGRAQNRRTEFHIAEMHGKKYLGKDPTGGGKVFE